MLDTVYTPAVVNAPGNIASDIRTARNTLKDLARRPLRLEREQRLESIRRRDEEHHAELLYKHDWLAEPFSEQQPTYGDVATEYVIVDAQIADPTNLILIDETDRLRMASLEQVRAIFDASEIGVILIGRKAPGAVRAVLLSDRVRPRFRPFGCWLNVGHQRA